MDAEQIKHNTKFSFYSYVLISISLPLMLTPYLYSAFTYSQLFFEMGLLLFGVSFVVSSNTEIHIKKSFYVSLVCGTVIIIISLLNIYKLYT